MKASELRGKTQEELGELLIEHSKELFNLRMQKGTGQMSKPAEMKRVKRDIARIHTVINEMTRA